MSQLGYKLQDKLGKMVHKIIFTTPSSEKGKFIEVCQRYFDPRNREMRIGKNAFPVDPADWIRQSKNRLIQYKDWDYCINYGQYLTNGYDKELANVEKQGEKIGEIGYYVKKIYTKPDGVALSSFELGANENAKVARSIVAGAALNVGWILAVALLVAGIMGGALLGYFGFPAVQGMHLVPNPSPVVSKLVFLL